VGRIERFSGVEPAALGRRRRVRSGSLEERYFMCAITASANALHFTSVAPGIRRAKS